MLKGSIPTAMIRQFGDAIRRTPGEEIDWAALISGTELIYIHPVLANSLDALILCCPYLDSDPETLDDDQLSEVLEIMDLLIQQERALREWLELRKSKLTTVQPKKDNLLQVLQRIFGGEQDSATPVSTVEPIPLDVVKTVGHIEILRDNTGEPIVVQAETDQTRYLVAKLSPAFPEDQSKHGQVCLIEAVGVWDREDILNLRSLTFGIPLLVVGRGLKVENDLEKQFPSGEDNVLLVYWLLKPAEIYRRYRIIPQHQLDDIIWKSKLDILVDYPQVLADRAEELGRTIPGQAEMLRNNAKVYQELLDRARRYTTLEELVETLSDFFESGKRVLSLARVEKSLRILQSCAIRHYVPDSRSAVILMLNLLFKLSTVYGVQSLRDIKVSLYLAKTPKDGSTPCHEDEGNLVYLEITKANTNRAVSVPPVLPQDHRIVARREIALYAPFEPSVEPLGAEGIFKHVEPEPTEPSIAGVWWGNPLACVALITVGSAPPEFRKAFWDSVAAIIELEDRPSRTANLPDPWPYNLIKVMRTTASNPNIRYLIIISAGIYCRETIERVERRRDLPPDIHPFITSELVLDFKEQIIDCAVLEMQDEPLLYRELQRRIRDTYLELGRGSWHDVGAFQEYTHPLVTHLDQQEQLRQNLSSLVDFYIYEFNASRRGQISEIGLVADTVREAYPGILASILKFGEQKGPDSLQRIYKDVLTHRTVIKDTSRDLLCLGVSQDEVDSFYRNEWMQPDGLFFTRMRRSFGADQVSGAIDRICKAVKGGTVTRSVIINIHHPGLDQERPLGINEIYFALRPLAERSYEIIGTFVWRSVEALFGMPYSIHASCRFHRYIIDQCNERLGESYDLRTGETIYMSLNLHLYQDAVNLEVAGQVIKSTLHELRGKNLNG